MIIPVMRLVVVMLVAFGVAAQPRPIGEAERSAVSVVASYLASGPEAVYAQLAADAPLRDVAKEDALREIAVRMGPRDWATWTLRTAERDAAFRVAWVSGYEDGLLLRMRGGEVVEILTLAERTRDSKAEAGPPRSRRPVVMAVVLAILGAVVAARWRLAGVVLLALATASAIIAYRERPPKAPLRFVELRELGPVREALARGRNPGKQAHDVAILWMLQSGLAVQVGGTKDDPLASLASVAKTPLAELLRARIALGEGNEDAAARAFARATAIAPVRDDLLYEAAFSFGNDRAKPFLDRLHALGSRDAEAYYRTKSFDALRVAWALEPKPREEMIRADLLTDLRAKSLVSFFAATEPVRRSTRLATRSLDWPAGAKAIVTGELLRVELGRNAIEVPNGAALAPKDAQVVAATYRAQQRDAEALRDAQELLEHGAPASRTRMVRAAQALAHHNRWEDVLKLSNALGGHEAIRTAVEQRTRRIEARRKLLENARTVATAHFDIRHDPSINPAIASRIGDLLEAELARVQKKLPPFAPRRVTVNVLQWDQFRRDITASDHTLGLYDGEIFIPFAAVEQFKREVVAIITHELTHALVAQATNDNAPRWFHEGVATRMELVERHENAFATTPVALVLPVTLLDASMEKRSDSSNYVVAQTFIRFLEDRYGAGAVAKIAAGFARGEETVFGKSLDELNVEFRQWGFHHNGEFVNDEPWPYDALYSPGIDPRVRAGFKF
jgi:Peptidase of plants and bacteria